MEGLKRTLAMFGIVIGVLYVFGILYDLLWNGVFHPVQLVVIALVLYAVVQLDRVYIRSYWIRSYWQSIPGWRKRTSEITRRESDVRVRRG